MIPNKRQRREQRERDIKLSAIANDQELIRATTFHESAHAVLSELLDYPVDHVTVVPRFKDGELLYGESKLVGDARFDGGVLELGYLRIISRLVTLYAGAFAEYRIGTLPVGMMPDTDLGEAKPKMELLIMMLNASLLEIHEMVSDACNKMLDQPEVWAAVTELADRLTSEKTVQGKVVREITLRNAGEQFSSKLMQLELTLASAPNVKPSDQFLAELETAKQEHRERTAVSVAA